MKELEIGAVYQRFYLEDYIKTNGGTILELECEPHIISMVPYQNLEVVNILKNVNISNYMPDDKVFAHCFRNNIVVVKRVK